MKWDGAAQTAFIGIPLRDGERYDAKMLAEKQARKNGRDRVTPDEIGAVKKVYFAEISEATRRQEIAQRVAAGETGLEQSMERLARRVLAQEIELFEVSSCRADNPPSLAAVLDDLKTEITAKLVDMDITERIGRKLPEGRSRLAHHRFTVALGGCVNGCARPETKSFGVIVVTQPTVSETACTECFACVDGCRRGAIVIRDGSPVININLCDHCGVCVRACPTGTLTTLRQGYKILVGGKLGRFHQHGFELYKMTDRETLFKALTASAEFFLENAVGEETFTALLRREGLSPIYQRMYQG
jgi:anaerobic sulfite reductase subunit C